MTPRAFQAQPLDNVATLIDDADHGSVDIIGAERRVVAALEAISRGHKIALRDVGADEAVIKLGARIGHATRAIRQGEWVHLHNLASDLDARSGTLDLHSGAPTDTDSAYA
ncbi:MAG: UxaA family hydrolase [Gemmatimonadaceae bacterium]